MSLFCHGPVASTGFAANESHRALHRRKAVANSNIESREVAANRLGLTRALVDPDQLLGGESSGFGLFEKALFRRIVDGRRARQEPQILLAAAGDESRLVAGLVGIENYV